MKVPEGFPGIIFPYQPDDGKKIREERINPIEQERVDIQIPKMAERFYKFIRERDSQEATKRQKATQAGTIRSLDKRTLRLPESQIQNYLIGALYPRFIKSKNFSFSSLKNEFKREINRCLAEDKTISDRERDEKREQSHQDFDGMFTGVESVLEVVRNRSTVESESSEYFIGTNDYLDATRKIDLVEYSSTSYSKKIRFIQVKTKDTDRDEEEKILATHESFLKAMKKILETVVFEKREAELERIEKMFHARYPDQDDFALVTESQITTLGTALLDFNGKMPTVDEILEHIRRKYPNDCEPMQPKDAEELLQIFSEKESFREGILAIANPQHLTTPAIQAIMEYGLFLGQDISDTLIQYLGNNPSIYLPEIEFYSVVENPKGIIAEIQLPNPFDSEITAGVLTE